MRNYLKKRMKLRERDLKYDFMPSMQEIAQRPANIFAPIIIWLIVLFAAVALIWSRFAYVDIVVKANGFVSSFEPVFAVKSVPGGRIKHINVKNGDFVSAGSEILSLDLPQQQREKDELERSVIMLKVRRIAHEAAFESAYGSVGGGASGGSAALVGEKGSSADLREKFKEKARAEGIADAGNFAANDNPTRSAEDVFLEFEADESRLKMFRSGIEKENFKAERKQKILRSAAELRIKENEAFLKFKTAEAAFESASVKTETAGIAVFLQTFAVNYVLKPGEIVGYVIPENSKPVFKAAVADEDVKQIKEGDSADIVISADRKDGKRSLKGTILSVAGASSAENAPLVAAARASKVSYIAEISFDSPAAFEQSENRLISSFASGSEPKADMLKLGMSGSCEIIVGKRTVLEYFLRPFADAASDSIRQ